MTTARMPAAFLGHGSPMNAIESNRYTRAWQAFGACAPARPRAVLVISAHWYVPYTAVTAMAMPRTIHDFFGFPAELFAVQYPAPGDPDLAGEIAEIVKPTHVGLDHDGWGLDHGTWSVLVHAFPKADIPVLQLSIDTTRPPEWHVELGAQLAPLRERGVVIVGSGNVVHNLRTMDWSRTEFAFDWARRFDDAATELLTSRPGDVAALADHPAYGHAVPTPEHFLPLLYVAGMARAAGQPLSAFVHGHAFGSISMACHGLDVRCPDTGEAGPSAPIPVSIRPEDTNT
ncbi:MAG: extradiol ring-cleavage dioxygenase [Panacagrimonas sp.]|jgi:4,5-DOPA dioxygenase extradiol|nr:4,5-DOPA dioxygenase extradiol [Panacagrimonas sp.]MCC2657164.1 extradiol ring-cleavage dioxygenase [Panacagrimonas sp.]